MPSQQFDVLLYGATGFVGKLVASRLDKALELTGPGRGWAIGGRSEERLRAVQSACKSNPPVIVQCDLADKDAVARMVSQARVVLNCAGPYATTNGEALLSECARQGKHYSDLAGEGFWQREMVVGYHDIAVKSGAKIVLGGGVDSVPSDLGAHLALKKLQPRPDEQVVLTGVYNEYTGAFSGGTLASGKACDDALESGRVSKQVFHDPYILAPGVKGPDSVISTLDGFPRNWTFQFSRAFGVIMSFFMAPVNAPVVRRSLALTGQASTVSYRECCSFSLWLRMIWLWSKYGFGYFVGAPINFDPKSGQGPPDWLVEKGAFNIIIDARTAGPQERSAQVVVRGQGDPGYGATSFMLAQVGLCLAFDAKDAAPPSEVSHGGVLTPSTALGDVLVQRLNTANGGASMSLKTV